MNYFYKYDTKIRFSKMEKAKLITYEMFTQRGYTNIKAEEETLEATKTDGRGIIAYYINDEKINKQTITKYMSLMNDKGINHSIIVYREKITSTTLNTLKQSPDMIMELFSVLDLQFNITKHRLQPKSFRCLNQEENKEFKKEYGVKFPIIKQSDPISKFYNFKKNDIVEVILKNDLVVYRVIR